jgi:mono/diheme cytochrome c family protein
MMRHLFILLLFCLCLLTACAPSRLPVGTLPVTDARFTQGEMVYMKNCHTCHPSGAGGLGPSLNDKPLPAFAIAFQVRHGLGAMPAFGPDKISDAELNELVAYVQHLHGLSLLGEAN